MESVIIFAFLFLSVPMFGESQFGSFTEHPEDYTALLGERHNFSCKFEYTIPDPPPLMYVWTVMTSNGTNFVTDGEHAVLAVMGIEFDQNTLTIPANSQTNGTTVYCKITLITGHPTFSNDAQLTVLGPPTPPKPVLTAVNNTLNISWAPAWSWADYPVTHYTVTLTNTTDGTVYTNHTNETVWYFTREEGAGPRCDVMVVKVTATSDIGEGVAGQTEGGFPIAPAPFEMMDCEECKVTLILPSSVPMITIRFKLPNICPYQIGHYYLKLYGQDLIAHLVERTEYTSINTTAPLTMVVDSGLTINNTYTIVVFVSNSEGDTNASITFNTAIEIPPSLLKPPTIITVGENQTVMIAGVVIGIVLLVAIVVVTVVITCMYRRRRRTGVAELNLAKIFLEGASRPPRGGPYTQTETRIYESIDGYQGKNVDLSPPPLPSIPPSRDQHYTQDQLSVPRIVFDGEKSRDSNPYLQLLGSENGKTDPEVRSTGSGEYTSMKSVSLRNTQVNNMAAVNRLALQTPQGFNEDNYMVFIEQGEKV